MGQSAVDHLVHMQTAQLLVLEFAIYLWKQTPGIGLAAEPVVSSAASHQFYLACCLQCPYLAARLRCTSISRARYELSDVAFSLLLSTRVTAL